MESLEKFLKSALIGLFSIGLAGCIDLGICVDVEGGMGIGSQVYPFCSSE